MAESNIEIRLNGIPLVYPTLEIEDRWPEWLLDDVLDADVIDA